MKKYSGVSSQFIDDFFSLYDIRTHPTDFVVDLDIVTKYLQSRKDNLLATLKESYVLNTDYKIDIIKKATGGRRPQKVLLTPDCFKLLCMQFVFFRS